MKYVYVPVWICPEPSMPKKEVLKSQTIDKTATTDSILKAMINDIIYLQGYSKQLEQLLEGYKGAAKKMPELKDGVLPQP